MMMFRVLKENLEEILLASATTGCYEVVGYQVQGVAADEVLGPKRRVQVFYDSGDFLKSKAAISGGPTQHEIAYRVELTVAAESKANLAVINDAGATAAEKAAAIEAFQTAAAVADESIDEFFDIVYQILMDSRNEDIGTEGPPWKVSSRWVGAMRKDNPLDQGEYVVLTGTIEFTCMTVEEVLGDTGTPAGTGAYDQTTDLEGDDNEKTGVTV
ncbi:MAG: hypothetical protein V3V24_09700 [Nitrospinaceae bacterium]